MDYIHGHFFGCAAHVGGGIAGFAAVAIGKAQASQNLIGKKLVEFLYIDTDMKLDGSRVNRRLAIVSGEDDGPQQVHNLFENLSRRDWVTILVLVKNAFQCLGIGKLFSSMGQCAR